MTESPAPTGQPPSYDYDLKVDDQVNKLLDLDHKLAFFMVTAAVATLAFTLSFAATNKILAATPRLYVAGLSFAAVTALGSAAAVLFALHISIRSIRLHIGYRYERKSFADLSWSEQATWSRLNSYANQARKWAFILLILSVVTQVTYLTSGLSSQGGVPVHHYGEDSTDVVATESAFEITFTNKDTGQKITMRIPRVGVSAQPDPTLTLQKVRGVADQIAHLLRAQL
jgi:hypothetical protein